MSQGKVFEMRAINDLTKDYHAGDLEVTNGADITYYGTGNELRFSFKNHSGTFESVKLVVAY